MLIISQNLILGNRPYEHLYEAALSRTKNPAKVTNKKIKRILEIWFDGLGVVSHHCFHSISSNEALTREAFMIQAVNKSNLTNIQIGQNRMTSLHWQTHEQTMLGTYFLVQAFKSLLAIGERQIRRGDVK